MLNRAPIPVRLALIAATGLIAFLAVALASMITIRTVLMAGERGTLREAAALGLSLIEAQAPEAALADIRALRFADGERMFVIAPDGSALTDGVRLPAALMAQIRDAARAGDFVTHRPDPDGPARLVFARIEDRTGWLVGADRSLAALERERRALTLELMVWVVVVGGSMAGLAALIGRATAGPLSRMTDALTRLAEGDLAIETPAAEHRTEIDALARALAQFKHNEIARRALEAEAAEARQRAAEDRRIALIRTAAEVETAVGGAITKITRASGALASRAGALAHDAADTLHRAGTVAAAAEQASANSQTVAAATQQMSASINEIGTQVARASTVARQAVETASEAGARIDTLRAAAGEIGQVTALITEIAYQTRMLALNATIEAARAGEAGKGFAVVANEVKSLAGETAQAADDITRRIARMQSETEASVSAIEQVGAVIEEMNGIAGSIAAAVDEQRAVSDEIARNIEDAAAGAREVSANISAVSLSAGRSDSAAGEVGHLADDLAAQSRTLEDEVRRFVEHLRQRG